MCMCVPAVDPRVLVGQLLLVGEGGGEGGMEAILSVGWRAYIATDRLTDNDNKTQASTPASQIKSSHVRMDQLTGTHTHMHV